MFFVITCFNILRPPEKPSPPQGPLEVSGMTDTSFTLSWQPSAKDGGSPIIEYIVEMRESTKTEFKKIGATKEGKTFISVNYLEKDHSYRFRITARNEVGLSEPYEPSDSITAGSRLSKLYNKEFSYCIEIHNIHKQ